MTIYMILETGGSTLNVICRRNFPPCRTCKESQFVMLFVVVVFLSVAIAESRCCNENLTQFQLCIAITNSRKFFSFNFSCCTTIAGSLNLSQLQNNIHLLCLVPKTKNEIE